MKKLLLMLFLFLSVISFSQTFSGTIILVIDGDTYVFQIEKGFVKYVCKASPIELKALGNCNISV
jgi:hypothetical protein